MATSGSFSTTAYESRYIIFEWSLVSQSIQSNTSTINWTLKGAGGRSDRYYLTQNVKLTINGTVVYQKADQFKLWIGTTVASGTTVIPHNNDGSKTFSASCEAGIYVWSPNCSGSGSWALDQIPRYAVVSQSLQRKTETTAVIKWTSDSVVDYMWYSSDNGSSWTGVAIAEGTSGQFTISGLSANTTYQVKTSVRRKDSQLNSESSALAVTTYAFPYATGLPSFFIGDALTVTIYNPLGRSVLVEMIMADNTSKTGGTITGTTIAPWNNSTWVNALYASIPSSQSGTYKIRCTYSGQTTTVTGGTYSVKASECLPVIGAVTYKDTDSSTTGITQDDQLIVRNTSMVKYTATGLAGTMSASISSASVSVNGQTYPMIISGTTANSGTAVINSGSDVEATVTVTDSRGITATKSVTVTMLDWYLPSAIITLNRQDNFYTATDCKVDASIAYVDGLNTVTITFRAKITGTSGWTVTGTMQDNVTSTFNLDNEYAWDILISLVDRFGGTTSYSLHISRGMPIIYFDRIKSSVGINCFPKDDHSLEVNGNILTRHIMTRSLSANTSENLVVNQYTKIPLDLSTNFGTKMTIPATDDGGIVIGSNVTAVLVSARILYVPASDGTRHLRITKNGSDTNALAWANKWMQSGHANEIVIPPVLALVQAGDVINLMYYTSTATDLISGNSVNKNLTELTVEVIG